MEGSTCSLGTSATGTVVRMPLGSPSEGDYPLPLGCRPSATVTITIEANNSFGPIKVWLVDPDGRTRTLAAASTVDGPRAPRFSDVVLPAGATFAVQTVARATLSGACTGLSTVTVPTTCPDPAADGTLTVTYG
ncbi:hypothetical protein K8Z61_06245 [Nocardioides sp. TRM66260-LWL]|uniref:hypothetical protein n=1 Tax=Nocardioides sp. TRM66260-LWL TaxID=2874478 RepID=UPI001CC7E9DF|nr:hypothetical protein [Nocardioides sp. TRM66260-LWL]MBZ5734092.1 hypothetical protein [Nocardioides sp. TRM66260-LWL]